MATTSVIASWVLNSQAQGFNRAADVIPLINEAQNILYKHECNQTLLVDTTTGLLPVFTPTTGTYLYDGPANTWRVAGIHRRLPSILNRTGYYAQYYYNSERSPLTNSFEYREIGGNYYYPMQFFQTRDAVEGGRPQIIMTAEPGSGGASVDTLYMEAYKTPTQITSDRIQLTIPDSNGAHRLYVFTAVMKLIEGQNHGNYAEAIQFIEDYLKPKMWKQLNGGYQGKRHRVTLRYF